MHSAQGRSVIFCVRKILEFDVFPRGDLFGCCSSAMAASTAEEREAQNDAPTMLSPIAGFGITHITTQQRSAADDVADTTLKRAAADDVPQLTDEEQQPSKKKLQLDYSRPPPQSQAALYHLLDYRPPNTAILTAVEKKALQRVMKHYTIPPDFAEVNSYGPRSGLSHEQRVLAAYSAQLLPPLPSGGCIVCLACGKDGHKKRDCPTAF